MLAAFLMHLLLSSSDPLFSWDHYAPLRLLHLYGALHLLYILLILIFFSEDFFVDFHVFWVYLQLYFSKIGLEVIFWITEPRSLLFQTAVPWNPFKILIELQFDWTVESIKIPALAFSIGRSSSSCPTWMFKIILQISSLCLLMTSFYHLSRC